MFSVPEGRKLFLWTKARSAVEMANLFLSQKEKSAIDRGLEAYNRKVDVLFDEAIERGWKPNVDDPVSRSIEERAALHAEKTVIGYKEACDRLDSLFGSALD